MKKTFLEICHDNEFNTSPEGVKTPNPYIQEILPIVEEREEVRKALFDCLMSIVFGDPVKNLSELYFSSTDIYSLKALGIQKAWGENPAYVWGVFQRKNPILSEGIKINSLGSYEKENLSGFSSLASYEKAYEEGGFHTAVLGVYVNGELNEASYLDSEDIQNMTDSGVSFEGIQRKMEKLKSDGVEGIEVPGKKQIQRDFCD